MTVVDSASIDLTLAGQQITAAAIFGTTATTVAQGSHTHTPDHAAVTVTDTASVDLTLTGQQISAAVIPGGISHTAITSIGTNTHAQIDTHLAASNPHSGSQPLDPDLTTLAANITAAGHALVDDADAAAQRTTLGLIAGGVGDIWVEKSGDTMTGNLTISTAAPNLRVTETDAALDEKKWGDEFSNGYRTFVTYNDAESGSSIWLAANRTGNRVDRVQFNESQVDTDVRIAGMTDYTLFHTDAALDRVGIGTFTPAAKLDVVGTGAFSGDVTVPDEVYGSGWDGSLEVPTKNALYDKIQTIGGGGVYLTGMTLLSETTFSAASSHSVNNVFSSSYENYRVAIHLSAATSAGTFNLRWRGSAADASGADYDATVSNGVSSPSSLGAASQAGATSVSLVGTSSSAATAAGIVMDVFRPNVAVKTMATWQSTNYSTVATILQQFSGSVGHRQATAYDGFSLIASAGTITGTCRVYGLQNTPGAAGSGAFPAGSDTQVQFNDAGVLGGDAGLTYNKTTDALTTGSVNFPDATGEKLSLYGVASYGIGVESNDLHLSSGGTLVSLNTGGYPGTARLEAYSTGVILSSLVGTGTRAVEASSAGLLSASAPLGMVLLETLSPSGVATSSSSAIFTSTYEHYLIVLRLALNTANAALNFRLRAAGADNSTANYNTPNLRWAASTAISNLTAQTSAELFLAPGAGVTSTDVSMAFTLFSPQAANETQWSGTGKIRGSTPTYNGTAVTGTFNATTQFDAITLLPSAGTITGTIKIYGLR